MVAAVLDVRTGVCHTGVQTGRWRRHMSRKMAANTRQLKDEIREVKRVVDQMAARWDRESEGHAANQQESAQSAHAPMPIMRANERARRRWRSDRNTMRAQAAFRQACPAVERDKLQAAVDNLDPAAEESPEAKLTKTPPPPLESACTPSGPTSQSPVLSSEHPLPPVLPRARSVLFSPPLPPQRQASLPHLRPSGSRGSLPDLQRSR